MSVEEIIGVITVCDTGIIIIIIIIMSLFKSPDSAVGIATGYGLDDRGVKI
jgi:hypothetical protein